MSRHVRIIFVLPILCATSVIAVSLPYVVVDTGQDRCYNNVRVIPDPKPGEAFYGQDAQYQGPQPAYRDNGNGTIADLNTGLMWQKSPPEGYYSWQEASAYAKDLKLGGYDDWRMPTMKELYSIVDFRGSMRTRTPYINTRYFVFRYPDTSQGHRDMDGQYWSSNPYVGRTMFGDQSAFGFNFADGRIKSYPTGEGRGPTKRSFIRCVRGGNGYGKNEFTDNRDGTITDQATGLMWQKTDSGKTMNWQDALAYAENLKIAGYEDWRLPNAKELQSIVDYTRAPDAAEPKHRSAAIDPIFTVTKTESWCWTSTTHGDNLFGIYICFGRALSELRQQDGSKVNAHGAGAQRSDPKSGDPARYSRGLGPQSDAIRINNYVRCVRTNR